ncbi:MAG: hypothetical protein QXG99_01190 [Conexivisphaerales archaeon]
MNYIRLNTFKHRFNLTMDMESSMNELDGLKFMLQEYREALRLALNNTDSNLVEEVGIIINQCTETMNIIDKKVNEEDNLKRIKSFIESIVERFNKISEILSEEHESSEEYDLSFLSDFLYYTSRDSSS